MDFGKLCSLLLPADKHDILKIKYYTAKVSPRATDPNQLNRQQTYFRGLETIPNFEIYYGHFLSHKVMMPRSDGKGLIEVMKTEEKGSEVNIASHMLFDAFRDRYDVAVLISNDSDLLEPIRILRNDLNKKIGYLNPQEKVSGILRSNSNFMKSIRDSAVEQSQFPEIVYDASGNAIQKPAEWY